MKTLGQTRPDQPRPAQSWPYVLVIGRGWSVCWGVAGVKIVHVPNGFWLCPREAGVWEWERGSGRGDGNKLSYTCKTPNESWSEQQAKGKWNEKMKKGKGETPEMLENRVGNLPEI